MYETGFIHLAACHLVGSFLTIAIIIAALGTMLGFLKPADTLKYCEVIVGIAIVIVLIVSVFVDLWSSMSLWQRIVLAAIGFGIWRIRQGRQQPGKKKDEE